MKKTLSKRNTKKDVSERIKPLKGMIQKIKMVIYGRSGTGKTTLASSFPEPVLFLDVKDEGLASVGDMPKSGYFKVEDWEDFELAYWYIKEHPEYKTIVVDTVSQLQELAIKAAVDKKASRSSVVKAKGDWGTMSRREWGDTSAIMKTWLINYRDLDRNVIFIAQDRTFNVDEEGDGVDQVLMPEVGPRLMPSVASVLNASVSVIGHTYIRVRTVKVRDKKTDKLVKKDKTEYCLRIGPNPVYTTKVRKPKSIVVPDILLDPTYNSLIEALKGEK